jgi:2-phospho-L-lactate guanylyltransferase (CobY/MobA/RfbA family)
MLLDPPGALAPRLGPDSLARHRAQAARRGVGETLLARPRLALDIDTPADLELLMADGSPCATLAACARLGLSGRLRAGSAL